MRTRKRLRRRASSAELDITAFMNLMVILVPFLLITAVFSRITILDLYLPPDQASTAAAKRSFQLEITLRADQIEVVEQKTRLRRTFKRENGEFALGQLSNLIVKIKESFPDKLEATILAEDDVDYDQLVMVMDKVRVVERPVENSTELVELFPVISIGDAGKK
jgi:biopolymer transport protein ExbD